MRTARRGVAVAVLFAALAVCVFRAGAESQRLTDDQVASSRFTAGHRVIAQQRNHLQALLDAFLTGDGKAIGRHSEAVAKDMADVARTFPPGDPEQASGSWRAMAEIVEESRRMAAAAKAGDYRAAYASYANLTARCIECHQLRRSLGAFPKKPAAPGSGTETDAP